MSMYEIAVADGHQHERAAVLLPVLGNPEVGRFRDCWVEKGGDGLVIAVYTRQGGGNREHYAAAIAALAAHPLYLRDADDEFDATYATFYFRVPVAVQEALAETAVGPVNMSERWKEAIARVGRGELRPAETAMTGQLTAMLGDPSPDPPKIMRV